MKITLFIFQMCGVNVQRIPGRISFPFDSLHIQNYIFLIINNQQEELPGELVDTFSNEKYAYFFALET